MDTCSAYATAIHAEPGRCRALFHEFVLAFGRDLAAKAHGRRALDLPCWREGGHVRPDRTPAGRLAAAVRDLSRAEAEDVAAEALEELRRETSPREEAAFYDR